MHQELIIYNGKEVLSSPNLSTPTFDGGQLEVIARDGKTLHRVTFDNSDSSGRAAVRRE